MKHRLFFLAAGLMLTACASTSTSDKMTLEEGAQQECRQVTEIGSILAKRVCYNKATWAKIDEIDKEQAEKAVDSVQSRRGPMPTASGFGG